MPVQVSAVLNAESSWLPPTSATNSTTDQARLSSTFRTFLFHFCIHEWVLCSLIQIFNIYHWFLLVIVGRWLHRYIYSHDVVWSLFIEWMWFICQWLLIIHDLFLLTLVFQLLHLFFPTDGAVHTVMDPVHLHRGGQRGGHRGAHALQDPQVSHQLLHHAPGPSR